MRPEEILDCQGGLLERLGDHLGMMFAAIYSARIGSLAEDTSAAPEMLNIDRPTAKDKQALSALALNRTYGDIESARVAMSDHAGVSSVLVLGNAVRTSYAYRVTHDMEMLLEHAAASLDDSDQVEMDLPPTGCGFVRFDRPIPVTDVRGFTALINWMVWGRVATPDGVPAIGLWTFNDLWTHPDGVWQSLMDNEPNPGDAEELSRTLWRFSPVSFDFMIPGSTMGSPLIMPSEGQQADVLADGLTPFPGSNIRRYAHALWLLLNQTIVTTTEEPLDRPARRRAGRRGIPPKVVTIKLRRSANTNRREGESNIEWSHRWVVRGHWRWQACGVGRKDRRRIWIAPFVKGPENAPLFVTDKVYDLSR